jgi:hypothetical protein
MVTASTWVYTYNMEIHSDDECESMWRERIAQELESEAYRSFSDDESAKWFSEGIRYAIMMIRWNNP